MEEDTENIPEHKVLHLDGFQGEVFACSWAPRSWNVVGVGGDGSARVWQVPGEFAAGAEPDKARRLAHAARAAEQKDVTVAQWSPDGKSMATAGYDGVAKVWSLSGELLHTLERHEGAVFALRWAPGGNLVLTGGADSVVALWDLDAGELRDEYTQHQGAVLDVAWRDDGEFASCSKVSGPSTRAACPVRGYSMEKPRPASTALSGAALACQASAARAAGRPASQTRACASAGQDSQLVQGR